MFLRFIVKEAASRSIRPVLIATSYRPNYVARLDRRSAFPSCHSSHRPAIVSAGERSLYCLYRLACTSRMSSGPPGVASSNTAITSRPVYQAKVSRLVRFFFRIGPRAC